MDGPDRIDGYGSGPSWWLMFRRVVVFCLGVVVIIDSLVEKHEASVGKLVVGLIMVGALPLDDLIAMIKSRWSKSESQQRPQNETEDYGHAKE